jgi:hypothetical protein
MKEEERMATQIKLSLLNLLGQVSGLGLLACATALFSELFKLNNSLAIILAAGAGTIVLAIFFGAIAFFYLKMLRNLCKE